MVLKEEENVELRHLLSQFTVRLKMETNRTPPMFTAETVCEICEHSIQVLSNEDAREALHSMAAHMMSGCHRVE